MKITYVILLALLICFMSCKKDTKKSTEIKAETKEISLLDTLTLKLNNGKKWVVNSETQSGIMKMDSIISAFKEEGKKDYSDLGKDLSIETVYIIRSCNMEGEAHDQLHVVLVPMLDEISILKESEDAAESKKALVELESLIEAYFNHFEN